MNETHSPRHDASQARSPATGEAHPSYVALLVLVVWGLLWVSVLADVAHKETFTTIWVAFGTLAWLAAIVVILGVASHRPWVWALGAIPVSFLGPLAGVLLFVPAIRHTLGAARFSRPRFAHVGQPPQGAGVEESRLTQTERPAEPPARKPRPHHGPAVPLLHLLGWLVGCIAAAAAILLGLLTLAVLAGVHKFTNHELHVILLISVLPPAIAILIVSWEWAKKGAELRQRATLTLPVALLAEAVLWGATAWLWASGTS